MILRSAAFACLLGCAPLCAMAHDAGTRVSQIPAPHRPKPLEVAIYYPAEPDGDIERFGANALFAGVPMRRDATPAPGRHPLVLFSHGSGGNAANLAWLGQALAKAGFIMAAPNHPGTTTGDFDPAAPLRVWERPADLSAVLDSLLRDARFGPLIDVTEISAAGFSLGGFSALASLGARLDAAAYAAYCDRQWPEAPLISECPWLKRAVDLHRLDSWVEASMRDPRFRRAVVIDPGLAHAASAESLSLLRAPVTIISLGGAETLPPAVATDRLTRLLPNVRQDYVAGAIHFSALGECRPDGRRILMQEGETEPLCDDTGRSRTELHQEIAEKVLAGLRR